MDDKNYIEIGARIRDEREKNNWTRDAFSEKISISNMYLSQLEKGQRHASLPVTIKIAEILQISMDYLIYGDKIIDVDKKSLINMIENASKRELKVISDILVAVLPNLKK